MNNFLILTVCIFLLYACQKPSLINKDISNKIIFESDCKITEIVHDRNLGNSSFFKALRYGNPYRRIEWRETC